MSDLIQRLRDSAALPTGLYAEAADEIERLKEDRDEWRMLADEHLAKLVDCKNELAAMVEASEAKDSNYAWLEEQLAAVTKERDELRIGVKEGRKAQEKYMELCTELVACQKERDALIATCKDQRTLYANCTKIANELDACQKDAERYRWLRETMCEFVCNTGIHTVTDAAIDAAMKEQRT